MRRRSGGTSSLSGPTSARVARCDEDPGMNRLLGALAVTGVALALFVPPAAAKDDDLADPAAREWSQVRGNSARNSSSAVQPLAGEPADAWKQQLPGAA